jgi:hypothetical protein
MSAYGDVLALERRASQFRAVRVGLAAIAVLALFGASYCAGDRHRGEADRIANADVAYRIADSISRSLAPKLAHVDTLVVHDTVTVRVAIDRVVTLRDTVLQHLTDTMLVKQYVARTDTALHACSELSDDCAQFRALAVQKFAADSNKFIAFKASIAPPPRFGFKSGAATGIAFVLTILHFSR